MQSAIIIHLKRPTLILFTPQFLFSLPIDLEPAARRDPIEGFADDVICAENETVPGRAGHIPLFTSYFIISHQSEYQEPCVCAAFASIVMWVQVILTH